MLEVLNSVTLGKQYLKALVCICDCALRPPYWKVTGLNI